MFKAIRIERDEGGQRAELCTLREQDLPQSDVLVKTEYSTLNYKDGLTITGALPLIQSFPMVPGIDLAGVVEDSSDPRWQPGDRVVANGWGLGEQHWGGLSQYARLKGDWLVRIPDAFTTRQAMAIGTAGYSVSAFVPRKARFW